MFLILSSAQKSVVNYAKLKLGSEKKHDGGGGVDLFGGHFKAQGVPRSLYPSHLINFEHIKSEIHLSSHRRSPRFKVPVHIPKLGVF